MPRLEKHIEEIFSSFVDETERNLVSIITEKQGRFPSNEKLLDSYRKCISKVKENGGDYLREYHEIHNELCTAALLLLDDTEPSVRQVEYEPSHDGCEKRFDFEVQMSEGPTRYLEVKTIHPIDQDDWEKYKDAVKNGRFADNTQIILDQEWLGGELYHNAYSARGKMMDYSILLEEKIQDCISHNSDKHTFLVLYSDGFDWNLDELEDFVYYYRNGTHYPGDPFAKMEEHHVRESEITLDHSIDCFAYIRRPKLEVMPNKIIWNVDSPCFPY